MKTEELLSRVKLLVISEIRWGSSDLSFRGIAGSVNRLGPRTGGF